MTIAQIPAQTLAIEYPESDGQPMAENTKQFEWIVTIEGGLDAQYASDPNVFVAGDLFWYPVEGRNDIRVAPDVLIVFGRPKGHRGRYLQWQEDNLPPQVVFEIWSPGNTTRDYTNKYRFYNKYGVQEYYLYDPDRAELLGWQRRDDELVEIETMNEWVSPRLGVRFEMVDAELKLYHPNGERFKTFLELAESEEKARLLAAYERTQAEQERARAEQERARADRLAAQLRELGVQPEA
ncbi:MAG: Uma2 family endonuclease [Chloroflexi bacterium]|nr:Uma2 family endonuclease [Chloroflexota bacterium]